MAIVPMVAGGLIGFIASTITGMPLRLPLAVGGAAVGLVITGVLLSNPIPVLLFTAIGLPAAASFQGAGSLPELLHHPADFSAVLCRSVQAKPAASSLPAQLPAGQHGLHGWHNLRWLKTLSDLIEEAEGQQHPWAGLSGCCR